MSDMLGRLVRELEALTPGGSEFVGSPHRCLEFIKDSMATVMKVAAKNKTLEAELEAAKAREETLRSMLCDQTSWTNATIDEMLIGRLAAPEPPLRLETREGMNPVERLLADASEPPGEE